MVGVRRQMTIRLQGDFNGLFGDLLCLSHSDVATDDTGASILLEDGMEAIAFEPDEDDSGPCFLVAGGRVVPSPDSLQHRGSRWCLQIDHRGVRHVSSLDDT
jgi:hypothetical protein